MVEEKGGQAWGSASVRSPVTTVGRFDKIPLSFALVMPFIILLIGAVVLTGYVSFRNARNAVNLVADRLRGEVIHRINEHLDTVLTAPHLINRLNADAMRQGLLDPENQLELERYFWNQLTVFESVTSIYFGNSKGGLVNSGREGAGGSQYVMLTDGFSAGNLKKYRTDARGSHTALLATVPNFDARTRQWYVRASKNGGPAWSPVYILSTGQDMAIAASFPVYDEHNNLLGVAAVDLFLSHLGNFLQNLEIGETGQAYIMDRSGTLIASSAFERPTASNADKMPRPIEAVGSAVPIIRRSAEVLNDRPGGFRNIHDEEFLEFDFDGQRQFLQVSAVPDDYGLDWLVVVVIPEKDFLGKVQSNNNATALIILGALSIALFISALVAKKITKPILQLNAAAKTLAGADWTAPLSDDSRVRELSELTRSFNRMSVKLHSTLEKLQQENDERKQAEEALRISEERHALALEGADLGTWDWRIGSGVAVFNQRWTEMLGYQLHELEPHFKTWEQLLHTDDRETVFKILNEHLRGELVQYETEFRLRHKSGHWVWVLARGKVIEFDTHGAPLRACGTHLDITDRKMAEKALRESEDRFKTLSEESPFGISLIDEKGRYKYLNPAFVKMFGYTLQELETGRDWFALAYPDEKYREFVMKAWREDLDRSRQGESRPRTFDVRCKDGGIKTIVFRPVTTVSHGQFVIYEDVTDRNRAEKDKEKLQAQLRQAQKMEAVGVLAGGIAHDFNNLLQAINGYTQLLLMEKNEDNPEYQSLNAIQKAVDRAASLVRQLLLFSRGVGMERRPVELNREVEQARGMLERTIPKMIALEIHPGRGLWTVNADPVQIEQILLNLGTNAADAMPDGGKIVIETENVLLDDEYSRNYLGAKPGRYVLLTYSDTGHGMDRPTVEKIFEPFFTTKEFGKGTGLGLASVYGIVKSHEGYITCYSEVGQGTTFKIYLPAIEVEEPSRAKEVIAESPKGGPETILLVDDEETVRDIARQALLKFGYTVITASSGEEALEIFSSKSAEIDLIIMDIGMPGMGGAKCLQEIMRLDPKAKILIASGYSLNQQIKKSMEAGAAGYVGKPYKLSELLEKVRAILDR